MRWRKDRPESPKADLVPPSPRSAAAEPDDRAWTARRNVPERAARTDLVPYMALPAETGPTWAPDEPDGGATLRLGPLAHQAAWLAIEAFLGRPLDAADEE